MLCVRAGPSPDDAAVGAEPAAAPSSTPTSPPALSDSERVDRLAAFSKRGERCHAKGEHDCVIDELASAYHLLEHEDRVGRLGSNYVDLMSDSCNALSMGSDVAEHRSRFEVFREIIALHISEIDNQPAAETTRKHKRRTRSQRKQDRAREAQQQRLATQRPQLEEQGKRLDSLLHRLDTELTQVEPSAPQDDEGLPTIIDPEEPPVEPSSDVEADIIRRTKRPIILGTLGIVGGSLAILSGASFMVNGAAWTLCNGKYREADGTPSTRCSELAGVAGGLSPITSFAATDEPGDFPLEAREARKRSARNWVLGSISTAIGISAVTWGAVAVRRARDRRASIAFAPSWSPLSPRAGALTITGRF
jgi:hypothetical protein